MHLAFVNGSNKRDFYVMRKEAKTCAYLLEPFSLKVPRLLGMLDRSIFCSVPPSSISLQHK